MEKLTLEQAEFDVKIIKTKSSGRYEDKESMHMDVDTLWEKVIKSMEYYTMEEARQIAKIILDVNREGFWYA